MQETWGSFFTFSQNIAQIIEVEKGNARTKQHQYISYH